MPYSNRLKFSTVFDSEQSKKKTHGDQEATSKESVPWILGVIRIVRVQENRPLVASYMNLAIYKLVSRAMNASSEKWIIIRKTETSLNIAPVKSCRT